MKLDIYSLIRPSSIKLIKKKLILLRKNDVICCIKRDYSSKNAYFEMNEKRSLGERP